MDTRNWRRWMRAGMFTCASLLALAGAGGPRQAGAQAGDPAVVGQWSPVVTWPVVSIHTSVLPNGKVLLWPRDGGAQARVWDPAANAFASASNLATNLFCSGHSMLPNGTILAAGGHIQDGVGLAHTSIFNFSSGTWMRSVDMNLGRWYPTTCTLGNGELVVVGGAIDGSRGINALPQVWKRTGGWRDLTGAQLSLPLYPFLHLAPNGKVFNAGPNVTTRYLDTVGTGAWSIVGASQLGFRGYGSSVMFDPGKVLLVGGHDPPTATAELIDLGAAAPAWRTVSPMAFARRQLNATLLADGKVLVTGGSSSPGFNDAAGSVLAAELWDPVTESFTTMAEMAERRLYHSTAILLPDGRVFSGGGGQPAATGGDTDHYSVEFYSPPYLFRGARPVVTRAPAAVGYGQTFLVAMPDTSDVAAVNWLTPGSVTHAFNMHQRINRLAFTRVAGGIAVQAPASGNLCPPGYYMLFVVNSRGVPSIARFVQVGVPPPSPTPPATPTNVTATGVAADRIDVRWNDNADNEAAYYVESSLDGTLFTQVGVLRENFTFFSHRGLLAATYYFYRVRASNRYGFSPYSGIVRGRTLDPPRGTGIGLKGDYFDNQDLTTLRVTRLDSAVNFDWAAGSPHSSIGPDSFSTRWTGFVQPRYTETYRFSTVSDDGARLWVNNQQLINNWDSPTRSEHSGTIALTAGRLYAIRLEYHERTDTASVRLFWSSPSEPRAVLPREQLYPEPPGKGLRGEYFDNMDLTGLKLTRVDPTVDFDWGGGAPDPGIGQDTFSARWTGYLVARHTETYTLHTVSDDGIRLWINGRLVIDNWTDHAPTENSAVLPLVAGQRNQVRMEFYENGGGAVARLLWSSASQAKEAVPARWLYPN